MFIMFYQKILRTSYSYHFQYQPKVSPFFYDIPGANLGLFLYGDGSVLKKNQETNKWYPSKSIGFEFYCTSVCLSCTFVFHIELKYFQGDHVPGFFCPDCLKKTPVVSQVYKCGVRTIRLLHYCVNSFALFLMSLVKVWK